MYRAALASGDFEAAAEHVGRYLQLDRQFSSVTDELDSRQLAEQRAVRHVHQCHHLFSRCTEASGRGLLKYRVECPAEKVDFCSHVKGFKSPPQAQFRFLLVDTSYVHAGA